MPPSNAAQGREPSVTERTSSTIFADDPTEGDVDDFLAEAFAGTEAPSDSDDLAEDSATASEALEPEAADAEEPADEDDEETEAADDEPPELVELRQRMAAIEAQREAERGQVVAALEQVQAERQRAYVAAQLQEVRAALTDAEWAAFNTQLWDGFKDHQITQLRQQVEGYHQAQQAAAFEAAEGEALEAIMGHVTSQIGRLSETHDDYLRSSRDAPEFKDRLRRVIAERQGMTEPARRALREQRAQGGKDRGGLRSSGGARPAGKTYGNFSPAQLDAYLDDQGALR